MTADNQLADIGEYSWPFPEATFYGRHVWSVGEEGDWGVYVEGHGRRALAALNAHQRDLQGQNWHISGRLTLRESWIRMTETCGCTDETHARHVAERDEDGWTECSDDCDDYGLPPCRDDYGWMCTAAKPGDPGAGPVTEVIW